MRKVLRTAVSVVAASLVATFLLAATAHGAVVSGSVTDPAGDGRPVDGVHPYDLASFALSYDDAGVLRATFGVNDRGDDPNGTWVQFWASARLGVWDPGRATCDVALAGSASLRVALYDVPPDQLPNVDYTVAGYDGDREQHAAVDPVPNDELTAWTFTVRDARAFAGRGYTCVSGVRLENQAGGSDEAAGTFCLSPSGASACPPAQAPIAIRWSAPADGQTVSGFLHEGPGDCLAIATGPVVRTENWVDGAFHDAQANAPWGCEIDTTQLSDGPHTLTVKAFAADGRSVEHSIRIVVANGTGAGGGPATPVAGGPVTAPAAPATPSGAALPSSPAGQTAAGGDAAAGTRRARLTVRRATTLSRRALVRRFGRAFRQRAEPGYRLRCRAAGAQRVACRVAWRYKRWAYSGTVTVRHTGARDVTVVKVKRRRAGGRSAGV